MSTATVGPLLDRLKERGVRLSLAGDRLRVGAPEGVLTENDFRELASAKAAIMEVLADPAKPDIPPGSEIRPTGVDWAVVGGWPLGDQLLFNKGAMLLERLGYSRAESERWAYDGVIQEQSYRSQRRPSVQTVTVS